ncbi:hypothetical protein ACF1AY_34620 [Streptomyces sp. NPDC014776]|uniref:hypothetical protein n=2 Tax=Streptomyces TaxID=1883 RepID=UPI0036F6C82F
MLAGNIMAIAVGTVGSRIGLGRSRSITITVLGTTGLTAFPLFMADVSTGWMSSMGMFERAVIYPIMIGHALLGSSLAATRRLRATRSPSPPRAQVAN